jgi:tripartite-type tricarboxylate transporter receptor subunit TctC
MFSMNVVSLSTANVAEYYKGKTIKLIVRRRTRSALDTTARVFAEHFKKNIPDNQTIVVKNVRGAPG